MKKILFIDACIRKESRTRRLAKAVLDTLEGDVETVICSEVKAITEEDFLGKRESEAMNDSGDSILLAKQFAAADVIVIAAPFWDLSFPAILKAYLEQINVVPITFEYTEQGIPKGKCKCQKLIYVTTAGGYIFAEEYGYGYVRALAEQFYGIPETRLVKAEGLDIVGADVEAILQEAIESIKAKA